MNNIDDAYDIFKKVLESDNQDFECSFELGTIYFKKQMHIQAF